MVVSNFSNKKAILKKVGSGTFVAYTLTVYVNVLCVLVFSYAWVIFVSRAVCHVLTYTAYTHAHTTHTCSLVVEFRLGSE